MAVTKPGVSADNPFCQRSLDNSVAQTPLLPASDVTPPSKSIHMTQQPFLLSFGRGRAEFTRCRVGWQAGPGRRGSAGCTRAGEGGGGEHALDRDLGCGRTATASWRQRQPTALAARCITTPGGGGNQPIRPLTLTAANND